MPERQLTNPSFDSPGAIAFRPRASLATTLVGSGGGLLFTVVGIATLVEGGLSPWLSGAIVVLGVALLVVVAGYTGWSMARGRKLRQPRAGEPAQGPSALVFGCGHPPTVGWVDRLIELPWVERRAMALRAPRGRARWIAGLLHLLEQHAATLNHVVLVMDRAAYPVPVRAAVDRLIRAHRDPPPGQPGAGIMVEHIKLDNPEDPRVVFVRVSGKLHELTLRHGDRRGIAVAPSAGSSPTDMALTLAASTYACELIYFPSSDAGPAPERLALHL